ncbi:RagB/SusD family nutrient uptake outer membrane protein [Polluticaenibacter yanchengensis]|uniref:RagB/SusD family nutrient uptake outer membrane protein n=1 Tax=Polluticaenibacter yanchengensis TaxID=3014562 RepID=A0ABT4UER7_9BACT|nr:RagB/SusD family nutrient uptake outer membrane protein [Chitinophagaceae bacterium LY-5]
MKNIFKNTIKAAILSSVLLSQTGCNDKDFLKENIFQLTSETSYKEPAQIELAINYLHNRMQYLSMSSYQFHNYIMTGLGLDVFFSTTPEFVTSNWKFLTPSEPGYTNYWVTGFSQIISYSNFIIEACDNPNVKFASETQKNQMKAEALFFRAWGHRGIVGLYGDWPVITQVQRSPKVDYVRAPRVDVWKQCREDLMFAAENLPLSTTKPGRIVRAAADHLLSEICISLGDHTKEQKYYDEAISAAGKVINGTDGDYQLMKNRFGARASEAGKDVYWDLFRSGNFNYQSGNKEAIWVVQYDYTTAISNTGGMPNNATTNKLLLEFAFQSSSYFANRQVKDAAGNNVFFFGEGATKFPDGKSSQTGSDARGVGAAQNRPTNYFFYDIWENNGGDIRNSEANIERNIKQAGGKPWKDVFDEIKARGDWNKIIPADTIRTIFPRLWKFSTDKHINGNPEFIDADIYIMRLPETYLLRAEAYMKKGQQALAMADINTVRGRANARLITAGEVTMDFILDERARELFGEEYRLVTLTRLSSKENPVLVNRVKKYGWKFPDITNDVRPNIQNHQWVYPIPQSIIDANFGATFSQNEGY